MRIGAAIVLLAALAASCGGGGFFRQYEYEEEMYLSLDGSATLYVNSSVPALNALRGSSFDTDPGGTLDREAIRAFFSSPVTRVTRRPSLSRRNGRRYVHARIDVDDVTKLGQAAPFAWSLYRFGKDGELFRYQQTVGAAAGKAAADAAGWNGTELVAVRLHLPSRIVYHNADTDTQRGNILSWEQPLARRLRGEPLVLDARIEAQSVLSRTLSLFFGTFVVVAVGFAVLIWSIVRRGVAATSEIRN